jgi:hypothetical protein
MDVTDAKLAALKQVTVSVRIYVGYLWSVICGQNTVKQKPAEGVLQSPASL